MKSLLFSTLCLLFVVSSSCKKDDCVPGNLETNIIGTWEVKSIGQDLGEVTFHSNGTLTDPDDALIGGEAGGVTLDKKSFTVGSNSVFTVEAADSGSTTSISFDYDVTSYTCDEIVINSFGFEATLSRK